MTRTELIAELAQDIAEGNHMTKFGRAFFLDTLMDSGRVSPDFVDVLLDKRHEAHYSVIDSIIEMVKIDATRFLTDDPRGQDYISDRLAEIERANAEDRAFAEQEVI